MLSTALNKAEGERSTGEGESVEVEGTGSGRRAGLNTSFFFFLPLAAASLFFVSPPRCYAFYITALLFLYT